ncbi:hypothetical protein OV090_13010 [Nannocystis sp. RBIL2]|nr:hypothetical protein [Nannocystis sp. RBIL2]MCY1065692.1 hypothetical protein [Nannocystis sp. RBIL2]
MPPIVRERSSESAANSSPASAVTSADLKTGTITCGAIDATCRPA